MGVQRCAVHRNRSGQSSLTSQWLGIPKLSCDSPGSGWPMEVITPELPLEPAAPLLDADDALALLVPLLPDVEEAVPVLPLELLEALLPLEVEDDPELPDPVDELALAELALPDDAPLDDPELLEDTARTRSPSGRAGTRAGTAWRRASGSQSMRASYTRTSVGQARETSAEGSGATASGDRSRASWGSTRRTRSEANKPSGSSLRLMAEKRERVWAP